MSKESNESETRTTEEHNRLRRAFLAGLRTGTNAGRELSQWFDRVIAETGYRQLAALETQLVKEIDSEGRIPWDEQMPDTLPLHDLR